MFNKKKEIKKLKGGEPIFIDKKSKIGVLMLHGFTSTPYQFRDLSSYLASKGITIYAPLIAGHGTSPEDLLKTTPNDWKNSVKNAYIELKKKVDRIVILGNSFGGNLCFWLAKEQDSALAGIVSLGTPIFLKFEWIIKLRYYLYGRFKKYYRKPQRIYKIDYTDLVDEITYPVIPIKSLKHFLDFLKKETIPNLGKIKTPIFIIHSNVDPVVHSKSAFFIHQNIGSQYKSIYLFESSHHIVFNDERRHELFQRIYNFIKDITN